MDVDVRMRAQVFLQHAGNNARRFMARTSVLFFRGACAVFRANTYTVHASKHVHTHIHCFTI
jgi:hypothetical protein